MAGFVNPLTQNLNPLDSNKGNVVQRLVAGPNGTQIQYVDASTGQVVNNPAGYNIIQPYIQDINDLGLNPTDYSNQPDKPTEQPTDSGSVQNNSQPNYTSPSLLEGGNQNSFSGGSGGSRDSSNNYGYIDKPGLLSAASFLPGIAGMIGKGVNAAVNANNVGAVNAARDDLGLDRLGTMAGLAGVARDRQGYVGNVDVKDRFGNTVTAPISIDNIRPENYSNVMTPEMAKAIGGYTLSEDQTPDRAKSQEKGLIRSFLDDLFSDDKSKSKKSSDDKKSSGKLSDVFPSAPSMDTEKSSNRGFTSIKEDSAHTIERERDTSLNGGPRGGLSDAARDSVDKGTGGLY